MALILDFTYPTTGVNELKQNASNGVYAQCPAVRIQGFLSTNTPAGETIASINVETLLSTITIDNFTFDGVTPTTPVSVIFGVPIAVEFDIIPSGTVGNTDNLKITLSVLGPSYIFNYGLEELDVQDSITIPNNTLPINFGTVQVGNSSNSLFFINNQTCVEYNYTYYSDNVDITFSGSSGGTESIPPGVARGIRIDATWDPTSAYDLSDYFILCDMDCRGAKYTLAGISFEPPPPPVGGASSKKLVIANSISI